MRGLCGRFKVALELGDRLAEDSERGRRATPCATPATNHYRAWRASMPVLPYQEVEANAGSTWRVSPIATPTPAREAS